MPDSATPWTGAPLSMGFSRQEYWNGLPCLPPGNLPDPGIEPTSLMSPALANGFFTTNASYEALSQHMRSEILQEHKISPYFQKFWGRESDRQSWLLCDNPSDHQLWCAERCHTLTDLFLERGPDLGCQYPPRQNRKNKACITASPDCQP